MESPFTLEYLLMRRIIEDEYVINVTMMLDNCEKLWARCLALPAEDVVRNCNMVLEEEIDVLIKTTLGHEEVDENGWSAGVRIKMRGIKECVNLQRQVILSLRQLFNDRREAGVGILFFNDLLDTAISLLYEILDATVLKD